ncbi:MAG: flagellar biosynthetic protein FliR [Chthonomonas sp.]|nr:flagellar biosynthetic protein FliR [Chthonomonas sp.]
MLTAEVFWAFFCGFIRTGAMMLASPIFAGVVPVQVRVWLSGVVALAIVPLIQPYVGVPPGEPIVMVLSVFREAGMGFLIGFAMQALFQAFQMAGSILDIQLGLSGAQVFDPVAGAPVTVMAQIKFWCAIVILFSLNGHHLIFPALVQSYQMPPIEMANLGAMSGTFVKFLGQLAVLAVQIAAPVAAVAFIVDAAAGLVNKSVPQFQVFAVITPAKVGLGLVAAMAALPILTTSVTAGVNLTFTTLETLFSK